MIDWFPVVFVTFKLLVLGVGMSLAVKWHYDKGLKGLQDERRAILRMIGKWGAVFFISLVGLLLVTFFASRWLGLDVRYA